MTFNVHKLLVVLTLTLKIQKFVKTLCKASPVKILEKY